MNGTLLQNHRKRPRRGINQPIAAQVDEEARHTGHVNRNAVILIPKRPVVSRAYFPKHGIPGLGIGILTFLGHLADILITISPKLKRIKPIIGLSAYRKAQNEND